MKKNPRDLFFHKINMKAPVSILIPVYNQAQFIGECLDSLLNQTTPASEIIVVNDGSTDNLEEMLSPYKKAINYFELPKNKGVAFARNFAIAKAKFELLIFQDGDDVAYPYRVAKTVEAFKDPHCLYIKGGLSNFLHSAAAQKSNIQNQAITLPSTTAKGTGVLALRKSFFYTIGPFNEKLKTAEDRDWLLRAQNKGYEPHHIHLPVIKRRIHENNLSGSHDAELKEISHKVVLTNLRLRLQKKNELKSSRYTSTKNPMPISVLVNKANTPAANLEALKHELSQHFLAYTICLYNSPEQLAQIAKNAPIKEKTQALETALKALKTSYFLVHSPRVKWNMAIVARMVDLLAHRPTFPFIFGLSRLDSQAQPTTVLDPSLAVFKTKSLNDYKAKTPLATEVAWLNFFFWHREQGSTFAFFRRAMCFKYAPPQWKEEEILVYEQASEKRRLKANVKQLVPFPLKYQGRALEKFLSTADQ